MVSPHMLPLAWFSSSAESGAPPSPGLSRPIMPSSAASRWFEAGASAGFPSAAGWDAASLGAALATGGGERSTTTGGAMGAVAIAGSAPAHRTRAARARGSDTSEEARQQKRVLLMPSDLVPPETGPPPVKTARPAGPRGLGSGGQGVATGQHAPA